MSIEDDIKRCISYDPDTGVLTLIDTVGKWAKRDRIGKPIGFYQAGYLCTKIRGRMLRLHRVAWFLSYGDWPDRDIDHINGDQSDNRLCNLRLCSAQQNSFNRGPRKDNTSGYRGVSWDKTKQKWAAQLKIGVKNHHLGRYSTPEEASAAVEAFAMKVHGEFYRPMT